MMDNSAATRHRKRTGTVKVKEVQRLDEVPLTTSCDLFFDEQKKLKKIVEETLDNDLLSIPAKTEIGSVSAKSGSVEFTADEEFK